MERCIKYFCFCVVVLFFVGRMKYCNWVIFFNFFLGLGCNCVCNCMFVVFWFKLLLIVVYKVDKGNLVFCVVILSLIMDKVEELR